MTEGKMELSIALSDNERTRPLIDGLVKPQGMRLHTTVVHPSEMFWRQLKYADFDVSEMSVSSLLIAASRGDYTWAAIPVFTFRMFFHTRILVRADRGIKTPQDLRGKRRVGVCRKVAWRHLQCESLGGRGRFGAYQRMAPVAWRTASCSRRSSRPRSTATRPRGTSEKWAPATSTKSPPSSKVAVPA
jgi:hypothetical protein